VVPISGRLPDDIYAWLSTCQMESATTISDKIRVAVIALRDQYAAQADYTDSLARFRDLTVTARHQVATIERDSAAHSEVMAALFEHLPALMAMLAVGPYAHISEATQTEARLVARSLQLSETLLRQALTDKARAFDPKVIVKSAEQLLSLARLLIDNSNSMKDSQNG
jgi:hypothetical protein